MISGLTKSDDSLVALMLGRLRMNVDDAIDALIAVTTGIFPEGSQDVPDPGTNSRKLKEAIEDMLQTRGLAVNTKMYERNSPQTACKVYADSYETRHTMTHFCQYFVRSHFDQYQTPSSLPHLLYPRHES
jgi:hypothetical protein